MVGNITAQILGGESRVLSGVRTVGEVKKLMNAEKYKATVNGQPADDGQELAEYDFVSLTEATKGGC